VDEFEGALKALKAEDVHAGNYVNAIDHELWATYAFNYARFGHDTNNITESVNFQWAEIRKLPPIQMMDAIYTALMKTVYERHHRNQLSKELADVPLLKFNERLVNSRRYQVAASGNGIYQVQVPDSGKKRIVNLKERTCDCTLFEEYDSPCTHAIAACRYKAEDPYKLFAEEYTMSAYQKTYEHFLPPFSIENLASTSGFLPPVFKNQRGRPTTKQIRKGAWKRKEKKCLKCYGKGHNIWKCRFAPAINGRQQRTREWDMSIDSSDLSDSSSSNLDSNIDSDSDIDEEALIDQIESNLHRERIARAWEIVNRQQAELDIERERELSVLASSSLNGMEGIETGGAKLGDVELGGIGAGLTGQDGDVEDVGGRVSNRVTTLGARTSLRRTRSGKVVKYIG
jgi:SWIM zinc finger